MPEVQNNLIQCFTSSFSQRFSKVINPGRPVRTLSTKTVLLIEVLVLSYNIVYTIVSHKKCFAQIRETDKI